MIILRANFTIQAGELSQVQLLQLPTHSKSKERNLTLLANEEACNFLRSQQENGWSGKTLLRINCPTISVWNKQAVLRRNFFPWKAWKNSLRVKSKKTDDENKIRYKCMFSLSLQSFWEKLAKPEKSQTYLLCIRINCSVVSTSVLFEETNWVWTQVHYCTVHPDNLLVFNHVISTTPAKPAKSANPGTVCRSQHL